MYVAVLRISQGSLGTPRAFWSHWTSHGQKNHEGLLLLHTVYIMSSRTISTSYRNWAVPDDAVAFFARCTEGLKPGGIIVVKENICQEGFIVDKVTPASMVHAIFGSLHFQCRRRVSARTFTYMYVSPCRPYRKVYLVRTPHGDS